MKESVRSPGGGLAKTSKLPKDYRRIASIVETKAPVQSDRKKGTKASTENNEYLWSQADRQRIMSIRRRSGVLPNKEIRALELGSRLPIDSSDISERHASKTCNIAGMLGVTSHIKEQYQRNVNKRQRQPTTSSYLPTMRETEEMRLLRSGAMQHKVKQTSTSFDTGVIVEWKSGQVQSGVKSGSPRRKGILSVDDTKFKTDEEIVTKMMMEMDSKQLQLVKRDFHMNGGELDLEEFVQVMMKYQPVKETEKAELQTIAKLCEFFSQVDINGDGSMEWGEFTSYIVESSQDRDNFRVDNIKNYNPSTIPPISPATFDTRVDHLYYVEELDYFVACDTNRMMNVYNASDCSLVKQAHGHNGVVHAAAHLSGRGTSSYLVTSANDSTIGFWDTVHFNLCQRIPAPDVQMALEWTGIQNNRLFSGGVDGAINIWNVDELENVGRLTGHKDIVMDLHSIESMGVIASASLDSQIKFWDIPTQSLRKSLPGHAKGVFSLAYAPEYRFLVSAGFDHDALVWNPYVEHLICPLKGHNSSLVGVKAIPNTPEIITADNEGFFKIWDIRNFSCVQTFQAKSSTLDSPTEQHGASIFANPKLRTQREEPYLSASGVGAIGSGGGGGGHKSREMMEEKVIVKQNVERRRNLESNVLISSSKNTGHGTGLTCFSYSIKQKRIIAANEHLSFFDYDQPSDPLLTDTAPTIGIIFNEAALTFTTAAGRSVKLWDAESGRLLRIYRDISEHEITALCFDGRKRKFIIGDHGGKITVFNLANGARMKELSEHESEIVALESLAETQRIISCSWDGTIKISDESDPEEAILLHQLNHHTSVRHLLNGIPGALEAQAETEAKFLQLRAEQMDKVTNVDSLAIQRDITAMAYSKGQGLLATAALDMTICLFNENSGAAEAICMGHTCEVSALVFLDPHPFLVSSDIFGNVFIWKVGTLAAKITPWLKFRNNYVLEKRITIQTTQSDSDVSLPIVYEPGKKKGVYCLQWMQNSLTLYTGDELGFVRGWDMSPVLETQRSSSNTNETQPEPKEEPEKSFFLTESDKQPESQASKEEEVPKRRQRRASFVEGCIEIKLEREERHMEEMKAAKGFGPKLWVCWKAHLAGVRSISLFEAPEAIATSSFDRLVYFWSLTGEKTGTLHQGSAQDRFVDLEWRFPVDREEQNRISLSRAKEVLDEICEPDGRVKRIRDVDMLHVADSESSLGSNLLEDGATSSFRSRGSEDPRLETQGSSKSKGLIRRPTKPPSEKAKSMVRRGNRPSLARRVKLSEAEQAAAEKLYNVLL